MSASCFADCGPEPEFKSFKPSCLVLSNRLRKNWACFKISFKYKVNLGNEDRACTEEFAKQSFLLLISPVVYLSLLLELENISLSLFLNSRVDKLGVNT